MIEFRKTSKRDKPEDVTLEHLCSDFLKTWNPTARKATIDLYKCAIRRLFHHFGKTRRIRSIGPREADKFLAAQTHFWSKPKKRLSESSRAQIVRLCKAIFRTAVRWEWISETPFANIRMPKPSSRRWHRMTIPEYRKLLEAAPNLRWQVFYALAYTSSARVGELFNLTWADIEFEQGRVIFNNREGSKTMAPFVVKDKEARYVQLPTETLNLLSQYQHEAPEGIPYILPTKERYDLILKKWHKCRQQGKHGKAVP